MKRLTFPILAILVLAGCSKEDVAGPDPNIQGQYNIYLSGDRNETYENGKVTLWNPGPNGDIITLGPEEAGQGIDPDDPTAQLTIIFLNDGQNGDQQDIVQVTLRTKEMAQGSYTHQFEYEGQTSPANCPVQSGLLIQESGDNFIRGAYCFELELFAGGADETITVQGNFIAISPF
ncbi:MAG: membrane lipoprotein lipid attachment site-containing protein [Saprospiraceae bacterium]|nr:membrane lipoprotein lipid attachment site-containing protein [Saprospiraceae bacterium]